MKKILLIFVLTIFALMVSCSLQNISDESGSDSSISGMISLSDLSNFRMEIVDATALGIKTGNIGVARGLRKIESLEEKNYLMKSTIEYVANDPLVDGSDLTFVTFTKITTNNSFNELSGEKNLVATGSKEFPHEGTIAFMATDGLNYSLCTSDGNVLIENISDNDSNDYDKQLGVIRIGNLVKGTKYIVKYYGFGEETVITQDEIDGEIDKLYVLGEYTFISFVPQGTSSRPSEDNLTYDSDGISFYDKSNYYSDDSRQSFIINNGTGYIYKLNSFHIKKIEGGCLLSSKDNYVYDFRVNEKNELEIFSIFTNPSISWTHVFKDKYGKIYLENNRLNQYDSSTNTLFFTYSESGGIGLNIDYLPTSTGEAIKIEYDSSNHWPNIKSVYLLTENDTLRELSQEDSFKIFYWEDMYRKLYKVENGVLYGHASNNKRYQQDFYLINYNSQTNVGKTSWFYDNTHSSVYYATYALEDFNVLLVYNKGERKLYDLTDTWDFYNTVFESYQTVIDQTAFPFETMHVALSNCDISDDFSSFLTYGPFGNTYYDVIVEKGTDGFPVVKSYVSGTYEKQQEKIILQPINR